MPANPLNIGVQKLLGVVEFDFPAADRGAGPVAHIAKFARALASESGTAKWARIENSDGRAVCDIDVGTAGAFLNLNTTKLIKGGPISLESLEFDIPEGS
jgi:hypothetical protein